jgi:TDG/mug DNA glycosylase family protein
MLLSFPPVADKNTSILILGSMPGRDSLNACQYYAHGRNAFWPIMAELFGVLPETPYDNKLHILQQNGIGLWDVIRQCRRETSLDSAIEEQSIKVNNFEAFLQNHPQINRICFNGAKAEQSFNKYVLPSIPAHQVNLVRLPSTSPANARMSFRQKLESWRNALNSGQ